MTKRAGWVAGAVLLAAARPAGAEVLEFAPVKQEGTYLCWAAAAETAWSVPGLGGPKRACEILTRALAPRKCCLAGDRVDNANCDEPTGFYHDHLPAALQAKRAGFSGPFKAVEPRRELVQHEIDQEERPVLSWWKFGRSCEVAGHVVAVVGIDPPDRNPPQVVLADPRLGSAIQASWEFFRCGPTGDGHCAVYHRVGGKQPYTGAKVDEFITPCSLPVRGRGDNVPKDVETEVEEAVAALFRLEMLPALGLPATGSVLCEPRLLSEVEFSGFANVRQLLLPCWRSGTPFFAAFVLRDRDPTVEIVWFGGVDFAREFMIRDLPEGEGRLVIRIFPESGKAQVFRADAEHEAKWLPTGGYRPEAN